MLLGIFIAINLIALSWSADVYHKRLKKITNLSKTLKHPKANKDLIQKDIEVAKAEVKKHKKRCFILFAILFCIHSFLLWTTITKFGRYNFYSCYRQAFVPMVSSGISCLILLVIFWLKGKGGGIPDNTYMERMGTGL